MDALLDKQHVLLWAEEVDFVSDQLDMAYTVLGRTTTGGVWPLWHSDSPDARTFLARDDPPLCPADRVLEGSTDDLEDVTDSNAFWVLGDCDLEFGYEAEVCDGWVHCGLVELRVRGVGVASEVPLGFSWA
jgi:hypothetical protein